MVDCDSLVYTKSAPPVANASSDSKVDIRTLDGITLDSVDSTVIAVPIDSVVKNNLGVKTPLCAEVGVKTPLGAKAGTEPNLGAEVISKPVLGAEPVLGVAVGSVSDTQDSFGQNRNAIQSAGKGFVAQSQADGVGISCRLKSRLFEMSGTPRAELTSVFGCAKFAWERRRAGGRGFRQGASCWSNRF